MGRLLPQIDLLEQRLTSLSLAEHYEADGYEEKLKRNDSRAKLSGARERIDRAYCETSYGNCEFRRR